MATREGTYWAKAYLERVKQAGREKDTPYDPRLDVQLAVDIGMDDTNVIIASQTIRDDVRLIDEIIDDGRHIGSYAEEIKDRPWGANVTLIILPHDAEVREHTSGRTRREVWEEEFPDAHVLVLPKIGVQEGIDMVRELIPNLIVDPSNCEYIVECFYNFTKEWDDKREKWKNHPAKNEWEHGASGLRYLAQGIERGSLPRGQAEKRSRRRSRGVDV